MDEVFETIVNVIEEVTDIPAEDIDISNSLIDDLDLSSIEIMSVVSELEKEFSKKLGENDLLEIATVQDLVDFFE
jgi:acyl carrier protein